MAPSPCAGRPFGIVAEVLAHLELSAAAVAAVVLSLLVVVAALDAVAAQLVPP
jgi:hypothetical protein